MLIQIVPGLPPSIDGVGDYALAVARILRSEFGVDSRFLAARKGWQGPEEIDGFRVGRVATQSARDLAELLDEALDETLNEARAATGASGVLLQMSGYGYSRRGCPLWLLDGLRQWKRRRPEARLITMFHELYASGPPWGSAFWLQPAQRMVIAGIAQLSDVALTNTEFHRGRLERLASSKRGLRVKGAIKVLAVPSNLGEPSDAGELASRARSMVVFGLPSTRRRTYETQLAALKRACEQLGITEIHDVGAEFGGTPNRVGSLPVTKHGVLRTADVSSLLSGSLAGFLTYWPESLAKSGAFAAYCAHRLVPVVVPASRGRSEPDGIASGVHYYRVHREPGAQCTAPAAQSIADAAWNWYRGHQLRAHARALAEVLRADR